jgi:hypothetical protein
MKTIVLKAVAVAAVVDRAKNAADLFIVRLTNLKTFSTLEAIIISMAN